MNTQKNTKQFQKPLFIGGFILLCISFSAIFIDAESTLQSYLFSILFWSDLPLGALPLLMIYSLTSGDWGNATKKILASLSDTIRTVALLFLPVLFGISKIYPWMDPQVAADPKISHKHFYLNPYSFSFRTLVYFLIWYILNRNIQKYFTENLNELTQAQEAKLRTLSAGGLVIMGFSISFAAIDWQMSIEPKWYSTIYGMIFEVGQCLSSYSFCLLILGLLVARESLSQFSKKTLRDLGNIQLTLVMTWAYLSFMQYLIIWSGNLPHEVTWFKNRTQGGWQYVALILFIFQFAAPFILLLLRASKELPYRLAVLGGLVFMIRIIDHYWTYMPGLRPHQFEVPWQVFTTWIGIGAIILSKFLKKYNLNPTVNSFEPKTSSTLEGFSHA